MAIFRRDSPTPDPIPARRPRPPRDLSQRPAARSAGTYIARGSRVEGEIGGATEVLIDGELHGRVELDETITVGRDGVVHGDLDGRVVRVEGKVHGDIRGSELVELVATASLEGDISAARVIISEGAYFKGRVEMLGGQGAAGREPAGAPPARATDKPNGAAQRAQGALYPDASPPAAGGRATEPREGGR